MDQETLKRGMGWEGKASFCNRVHGAEEKGKNNCYGGLTNKEKLV